MSDTTIDWADKVWNPVSGCSKVSPGCAHCYAEDIVRRFDRHRFKPWTPENAAANVRLVPGKLGEPLRWRQPQRVFVNSMSDLFHEQVPEEFIDSVFAVMAMAGAERQHCSGGVLCKHNEDSNGCWHHDRGRTMPVHTFLILTKRPERMLQYVQSREHWRQGIYDALNGPEWPYVYEDAADMIAPLGWPLPNVWLGVSVENQHWADVRIPLLLQTPAAVRFVSAEPLLGPVHLRDPEATDDGKGPIGEWDWLGHPYMPVGETFAFGNRACGWRYRHLGRRRTCGNFEGFPLHRGAPREPRIDWVIVGGESGQKRRPFDRQWARIIREDCRATGVAYFGKQDGGRYPSVPLPGALGDREFPGGVSSPPCSTG